MSETREATLSDIYWEIRALREDLAPMTAYFRAQQEAMEQVKVSNLPSDFPCRDELAAAGIVNAQDIPGKLQKIEALVADESLAMSIMRRLNSNE